MADEKISAMPAASVPFNGSEAFPLVRGGGNQKVTADVLAAQLFNMGNLGFNVSSLSLLNLASGNSFGLSFDGTYWTFSGVQFNFPTPLKVASAGLLSSDGSPRINATITTAALVGKTITIKDGIITGFA